MHTSGPKVTVIGSINMDLVVRCHRLPLPGQTVLAESSAEICGGKGANQAVAASRAGGQVRMIGRVGGDAFAGRLIQNLQSVDVNVTHVHSTNDSASGLAIVAVEHSGQNAITVVPGANALVTEADVRALSEVIADSDVLLLQLEIPVPTVLAAIEIGRAAGVRIILDPAPAPIEWPQALFDVDLICPNETEAAAFAGQPVHGPEDAAKVAERMESLGANAVAITMGEQGTLLWHQGMAELIPPVPVTAVDSTAAGDAFAGAVAVRWAESGELTEAIAFGNAAGAWSAAHHGAQPSMGGRDDIETLRSKKS